MVMDLGYLGDSVQLLPSLWILRQALPKTKLHVMVDAGAARLFDIYPWVDHVWGYRRHQNLAQSFGLIRELRSKHFDAVINLNGSQRSSIITWLSGAPLRLGRIHAKKRPGWKYFYTHYRWHDFGRIPVYRQRANILIAEGFPEPEQAYEPQWPQELSEWWKSRDITKAPYVHVSPCASSPEKELPPDVLAHSLNKLSHQHPEFKWALSCGPAPREKLVLKDILEQLEFKPACVHAGDLSIPQLTRLIAGAKLHMGADSGALHLAIMTKRGTLGWYRTYDGLREWMPVGAEHAALIGQSTPQGLSDITVESVCDGFESILGAAPPPSAS